MTDVLPDASSGNKWTCTCFSAYRGNQSVAHLADCASSCNCSSGRVFHLYLMIIILFTWFLITYLHAITESVKVRGGLKSLIYKEIIYAKDQGG